MSKKPHLTYQLVQRVKTEEYSRFFRKQGSRYSLYSNHLGELKWLTAEEARQQHEFYPRHSNVLASLFQDLQLGRVFEWRRLSPLEKEIRLRVRRRLDEKYGSQLFTSTVEPLSEDHSCSLSDEELDNIPITEETYRTGGRRSALAALILVLMLAVTALTYWEFGRKTANVGTVQIKSNIRGSVVFVDQVKRGYADQSLTLKDVPVGIHRIRIEKPGFLAIPASQEVEVTSGTVAQISFRMLPKQQRHEGYLKVVTDYQDSKIFVDDEFYGMVNENPVLALPDGDHSIALEKRGVDAAPDKQWVSIQVGDTVTLTWRQQPRTSLRQVARKASSEYDKGSLDVSANVSGATIFLNDENSGMTADYVFSDLPYGRYRVRLEKEGYSSEPPEQEILLDSQNNLAQADFRMVRNSGRVSIRTSPAQGEIYVDGRLLSRGTYNGLLDVGSHEISFGEIPGFKTPAQRTVQVTANNPISLSADYLPHLNLVVEVTDNGSIKAENCDVSTGYTLKNVGFATSSDAGPKVVYQKKLNQYLWKMGFAMPAANRKGNDALKLNFSIPKGYDPGSKIVLKLFAAASYERYPLAGDAQSGVMIRVNGFILRNFYKPAFLEDTNDMQEMELDISQYVKPGPNSIEISTTDDNTTYYFVKKISIIN